MDIIALLGKDKELNIRITSYVKGMSGKDVRAAILDEVQRLQATEASQKREIADLQRTAGHFREEANYYKQALINSRVENERLRNTAAAQKKQIASLTGD